MGPYSRDTKKFSSLSFFLLCCFLFATPSTAQQKPEEALADLAMAQDEAAVLTYLPKAMVSELDKISREQREEFLKPFLVEKSLAAEGIELSRSSDKPFEFRFLQRDGKLVTLTHTGTDLDGHNATVHFLIDASQTQTPLIVRMRSEDGSWRLINVEAQGKLLIPSLDEPQQALKILTAGKFAANEASAVGSLRTINTAAVTYQAFYPEVGVPPDLSSLGPAPDGTNSDTPQHAGVLDSVLGCPDLICVKSGYKFHYQRLDKDHYRVTAVPVTYGATGARNFFTNETGIIRVTGEDREAHESDEPLQ